MGAMVINEHDQVEYLFLRLKNELGQAGIKAAKMIIEELGGQRVSVPNMDDLYRKERDKKIRNLFHGDNISELAVRFDLSPKQIRRIVIRENYQE